MDHIAEVKKIEVVHRFTQGLWLRGIQTVMHGLLAKWFQEFCIVGCNIVASLEVTRVHWVLLSNTYLYNTTQNNQWQTPWPIHPSEISLLKISWLNLCKMYLKTVKIITSDNNFICTTLLCVELIWLKAEILLMNLYRTN